MAKPIRFTPKKTAAGGWRLNIPAKLTETGKRERRFFRTKELALIHADDMRKSVAEFGERSQTIRPSLAEHAVAAEEILKPWGIGLLDAARMVAETKRREASSMDTGAALDAWLASCEGLREKTLRNYKVTSKRVRDALAGRIVATLTAEELQAVVMPPERGAGAGAAEQMRNARAWWNFCAAKGWCQADVFAAVAKPKARRDRDEISILTPKDARGLLAAAQAHFPQAVASIALQLFAGIRAEELARLEAQHVSEGGIELPAGVAKTGRRRHIEPNDTLRAWLAAHPFAPCPNWRAVWGAVRRLAGWDVAAPLAVPMKPTPPSRGPWQQNALRHSHATYAVAAGMPLERLLFEFGHVGGTAILRQHYAGRATLKTALEYFAIRPDARAGKVASITEGRAIA